VTFIKHLAAAAHAPAKVVGQLAAHDAFFQKALDALVAAAALCQFQPLDAVDENT